MTENNLNPDGSNKVIDTLKITNDVIAFIDKVYFTKIDFSQGLFTNLEIIPNLIIIY